MNTDNDEIIFVNNITFYKGETIFKIIEEKPIWKSYVQVCFRGELYNINGTIIGYICKDIIEIGKEDMDGDMVDTLTAYSRAREILDKSKKLCKMIERFEPIGYHLNKRIKYATQIKTNRTH